jgi:hypothetical protein
LCPNLIHYYETNLGFKNIILMFVCYFCSVGWSGSSVAELRGEVDKAAASAFKPKMKKINLDQSINQRTAFCLLWN